jgi:hypothetical protein
MGRLVVEADDGGGGLVEEALEGVGMYAVPLDGLGCDGSELLLCLRFENPRDFSREVIRSVELEERRGRERREGDEGVVGRSDQ